MGTRQGEQDRHKPYLVMKWVEERVAVGYICHSDKRWTYITRYN